MKNIHVLTTDKPSRLHLIEDTLTITSEYENSVCDAEVNIYITSDEEIKEGDWYLNTEEKNGNMNPFYGKLYKGNKSINKVSSDYIHNLKKIILTTDEKLITEGVQPIDEEFLEWFVNNSSCEVVEVKPLLSNNGRALFGYKIIILQEKPKFVTVNIESATGEDLGKVSYIPLLNVDYTPKQETLEEANWKVIGTKNDTFYNGAKWMQERMYSEEDMREAYKSCYTPFSFDRIGDLEQDFKKWFEQFKKK